MLHLLNPSCRKLAPEERFRQGGCAFIPWLTLHGAFHNRQYVKWMTPTLANRTQQDANEQLVSTKHYLVPQRILSEGGPRRGGIWNTQSGGGGRWAEDAFDGALKWKQSIWQNTHPTPPSAFILHKKLWHLVGLDVLNSSKNATTSKEKWIHVKR